MQKRSVAAGAVVLLGVGYGFVRLGAGGPGPESLTVTSSYHAGPNGELYTEGAVVQVDLLALGAGRVGGHRTEAGHPIVFRGLEPGSYTLRAALRPCDGNCSSLDPPADGCTEQVTVPETATVAIAFVAGGSCTFSDQPGPSRSP